MNHVRLSRRWAARMGLAALATSLMANAVEVHDLKGFEDLFGRYAPGGDCQRQPQIVVDVSGFVFEVNGKKESVTNPEYAASYGPHDYDGLSRWFFPFREQGDYPILMTFNYGEDPGTLMIEGQGEGFPGGPPFSPMNKALVSGSPYARCN